MPKYLHVGFTFEGKPVEHSTLVPHFNRASDWLRYAPNCWIIYTDEAPQTWRDRLNSAIGPKDFVLVFELNWTNWSGYVTDFSKKWLEKRR
jgi:hypothetical protein